MRRSLPKYFWVFSEFSSLQKKKKCKTLRKRNENRAKYEKFVKINQSLIKTGFTGWYPFRPNLFQFRLRKPLCPSVRFMTL